MRAAPSVARTAQVIVAAGTVRAMPWAAAGWPRRSSSPRGCCGRPVGWSGARPARRGARRRSRARRVGARRSGGAPRRPHGRGGRQEVRGRVLGAVVDRPVPERVQLGVLVAGAHDAHGAGRGPAYGQAKSPGGVRDAVTHSRGQRCGWQMVEFVGERELRHRACGETRVVPCPPALTALLHAHLDSFGNGADGLLFRGVRGGEMSESTYCPVWRKARVATLTADEARSPLARRPYDLRHAPSRRGSTPAGARHPGRRLGRAQRRRAAPDLRQVPRRQEDAARRRIDAALGGSSNFDAYSTQAAGASGRQPDTTGQSKIAFSGIAAGQSASSRVTPVGLEPTLEPF